MQSKVPMPHPTFSPLYRQIKSLMVHSLETGDWKPGEPIPSESDLAARFSVSQGTVRKAIDEMAQENLLVRRQGKGTFVATHSDPGSTTRFLRVHSQSGETEDRVSRPLSCQTEDAGHKVARALGLAPGERVYRVERLLEFAGIPVVYDEIFLPEELFSGLDLDMLKSSERSLYSLFESRFGIHMVRAEERISAVLAENHVCKLLGVEEGCPLLLVDRIAMTYANKPVEWRRGHYLTKNHCYVNELL